MHDGSIKKVEDVIVGDALMGPDGKPRKVLSLHRGRDEMFNIIPVKGKSFTVNGGHILSLQKTAQSPEDRRAGEIVNLSVYDWMEWCKHKKHLYKLYRSEAVEFGGEKKPLQIEPYFLGLLIGDGGLRYGVTVNTMDPEVVGELRRQALLWVLSLTMVEEHASKANTYRLSGVFGKENPIARELRSLGLFGKLSVDKFIPQEYKTASIEDRLQLLAGLLDTDGHTDHKCCEFSSGSRRLAEDVAFIARSLGFYCLPKKKIVNGGTYWRFNISGDLSRIPFRVGRRKASARSQKKSVLRTGFAVESIGEGDYFGFTVDGDHLYLMGDFTVTHNSGKTIMLGSLAKEIGGKTLVLQHRQELVWQNMRKFRQINEGASCSFFTATRKSFNGDATFAMVQSLYGHLEDIPKLDLVIADEAHHCVAPTWRAIIERAREVNPSVLIAGFTATPSRTDGKGLRKIFDNVCDKISLRELIELGFLVKPRCFILNVDGSAEKLKALKNQSDFGDQNDVADILDTEVVNSEVIRHWKEKAGDRPTVVFAATVEHAANVARAFCEAGVPAECVHGELSARERRAILKRMTSGETKAITNCMVLTEGWDYPPVSCVILLRKCSGKGPMIQMAGRGLRTVNPQEYPGIVKRDCIILDFGISLATHGGIEADVELEDRYKKCPECKAKVLLGVKQCPECGYVWEKEQGEGEGEGEDEGIVLEHVELSEIEILGKSMWRYVDLFNSGRCLVASGFNAWAGIFSKNDDTWYAIGRRKNHRVDCVHIGERTQALAAADDFLRTWENEAASRKTCRWLNDPATDAQMYQLARFGETAMRSKYEAAAQLSFRFAQRDIERILGA